MVANWARRCSLSSKISCFEPYTHRKMHNYTWIGHFHVPSKAEQW